MTLPATDGELEDLVRRIVTQVPGVSVTRVMRRGEWNSPRRDSTEHRTIVSATVSGWSPTLHERESKWRADIGDDAATVADGRLPDLTGPALGARIRHQFKDRIKAQREIAAAARKAGITHPRGLPNAPGRWTIGHLHATTADLDLLVRDLGAERALTQLANRVSRLHERDTTDSQSYLMEIDGDIAGVFDGRPTYQLMQRIAGDRVTLRGRILTVRDSIPATLLEALPGRPVRALVETGIPSLDDAIITEAETKGSGDTSNVLTISLPTVRVADHPALGPALNALGAVTPAPVEGPSPPRAPRKKKVLP